GGGVGGDVGGAGGDGVECGVRLAAGRRQGEGMRVDGEGRAGRGGGQVAGPFGSADGGFRLIGVS
ncbi:PE-PGRS family protein, partial [Streptomyces albidoflavus]